MRRGVGDGPGAPAGRGGGGRRGCASVGENGGTRGRGMKMQKGAGGLAQYRRGGASAFILFFVRRRVARSFFQDGRATRAPV